MLRALGDMPNLLRAMSIELWSIESKAFFQSKKRKCSGWAVISDHSIARLSMNKGCDVPLLA